MSYRRINDKNNKDNIKEPKEEDKKTTKQKNNNYEEENLEELIKAFEYFDIEHTGKINTSDLIKALSTFGNVMTEDEIYNIFKTAGIELNSDKVINYIQFIEFWIGNS